jgi:PelA/Pel-15E family pectate lyase
MAGLLLAATLLTAVSHAQDIDHFSDHRLDSLPEQERIAWMEYLDRSAEEAARDRAFMDAEVKSEMLGERHPAPKSRSSLISDDDAWFATEEARRIADILVSYQTPSGGWAKNVDFRAQEREPGQSFFSGDSWSYIGTFDNDATTQELRFLGKTYLAQGGDHFREAFNRGLQYVLRAQFPNGCWPQVYPLQGGYHDAATFNDEAIPNILSLFRRIVQGEFAFVSQDLRARLERAKNHGIQCILDAQIRVDGNLTAWGQQHDPLTLAPTQGRSYEHPSITAGESVDVVEFLMGIEEPSPEVIEAVYSAVDWFESVALYDLEYEHPHLIRRRGAGPLWARFYEIGTDRPIFSNRDGVVLYDWHDLDDERRRGYGWYRYGPATVLRWFQTWSEDHPRP